MASGSDRNPIIIGGLPSQVPDFDPEETQEWLDSLDAAVDERGRERARYLMLRLIERAREKRVAVPEMRSTDYVNTIATKDEPFFPGNEEIERKVLNATRWNAAVMVSRAQRPGIGVGGHIATFASSASLYDVGFNHFFRGKDEGDGGDQIFFQGHASPGIYARAFLLDRLSEQQLDAFRQEKSKAPYGLSVVPAPAADAGLLGVPDRLDGPRPARRDLPGADEPLHGGARHRRHLQVARLGVPRRRRDGRAGVARPAVHRRPRGPGQPDLRRQLQPAAPRRPGARQRQDHPGAGVAVPRRRLERHQAGLGPHLGPAARAGPRRRAGQPAEHHARRPVPDVRHRDRRVHPRPLLRSTTTGCARWSRT